MVVFILDSSGGLCFVIVWGVCSVVFRLFMLGRDWLALFFVYGWVVLFFFDDGGTEFLFGVLERKKFR